jgi:hypothetical protein
VLDRTRSQQSLSRESFYLDPRAAAILKLIDEYRDQDVYMDDHES